MRISYANKDEMARLTLAEFEKRMSYLKRIDKDFDFEKEWKSIGGKPKKAKTTSKGGRINYKCR